MNMPSRSSPFIESGIISTTVPVLDKRHWCVSGTFQLKFQFDDMLERNDFPARISAPFLCISLTCRCGLRFRTLLKSWLLIAPRIMSSDSVATTRKYRARLFACVLLKILGQLMMIVCDVLIIARIAWHSSSYHLIVSAMCPVFHLHVAVINATVPAAYKSLQSSVLSLQVSDRLNAKYLVRARQVIAVVMQLAIVFMLFMFVIFSPLFAPDQVVRP